MTTEITPETFLASHLTLEKFNTIAPSGTSSTAVTPILSLNTSVPDASTKTGYKIYPNASNSRLVIDNQISSDPATVQIGQVEGSKIVFPATVTSTLTGSEQTITTPMTQRTGTNVTDTDYVNGIKFSNDAEFTVPNPDYSSSTNPSEPETVTVRISDIYKVMNLIKHIQNYDNVISALCRSANFQRSSTSVTHDAEWIQAYASINTDQPPVPDPAPGPA